LLAGGLDVKALRPSVTNAGQVVGNAGVLRVDEWKRYDRAVVPAARSMLSAVGDLMALGLFDEFNGMASSVVAWDAIADMGDARLTLDPTADNEEDDIQHTPGYMPLPIAHKGFSIGVRELNMSRNTGVPLSTSSAESAAYVVAKKIEQTLVNGASSFTAGGGTIYGYLDFPQATTVSLSNGAWDLSASATEAKADVLNAIQASRDNGFHGPWHLYHPMSWSKALDDDYTGSTAVPITSKTLRNRLLEIDGLTKVKGLDVITVDKAVLVNMSPNTVKLQVGLQPTTVQWDEMGGMRTRFMVMSMMVPTLRSAANGNSGIIILQ
jgi:uncharacterized linocin/CFP29 family protein